MSHAQLMLSAPFDGVAVPLNAVRDPVFAGLMMGDGLAIEPLSSTLRAPCAGVITHLARTGHALTLKAANGAELMIHIGIDTVQLEGRGFTPRVQSGDAVLACQVLVDVDIDAVAREAASLQTMVVVLGDEFEITARAAGRVSAAAPGFMSLQARSAASASIVAEGLTQRGHARVLHGNGLHARPCALVQSAARGFAAEVLLAFGGRVANAKSLTALMGLGVGEGDEVEVSARGPDAGAALQAVTAALQTHSPAQAPAATEARSVHAGPGLAGICAAPGLAIARVVHLDQRAADVPSQGEGVDTELTRLSQALAQARAEIGQAINAAARHGAQAEQGIFGAHLALAEDPELIEAAERGILAGEGAGFALRRAIDAQCTVLHGLGNALLAERVNDLKDLERRVLAAMGYLAAGLPDLSGPSLLLADELTPSDLTRLPRALVAGLATVRGGSTSHVAILARSMGIPALVALGPHLLQLAPGSEVLIDADSGLLFDAPTSEQLAAARQRIEARTLRNGEMLAQAGSVARTRDGVSIEVAANIANEADAREALRHGADGVGLLRTEFLFIDRTEMPSADEQRQAYQAVLDALDGRPAIIRTMDVGGDKEVPYLSLPAEDNPALGLRGIRAGLAQPGLLDLQLRALLALRPLSSLRILIPMITDVSEVLLVRARLAALAAEAGLAELPQLGVMIEVPSAALLADQLARHVDFFSIGTNDLTQYTLAMDRCHAGLAARLDPMHPALLRLIAMTADGAARHGKWVGMCGGMASDPLAVPVLLGLGVSELSVSAPLVPEIKSRVRELLHSNCRSEVQGLMQLESAEAVRAAAQRLWPQ